MKIDMFMYKKLMIGLSFILIFSSLSWFLHPSEGYEDITEQEYPRYFISHSEAKSLIKRGVSSSKDYFYVYAEVVKYRKTYIPLYYKVDTTYTTKIYYSIVK
jgi:hypothetical protein